MKLPNFLVIGAARAGTTALYQALQHHPEVFLPKAVKETYFFSQIDGKPYPEEYSNAAYHSLTHYRDLYKGAKAFRVIGEICNSYLYYFDRSIENILKILGRDVRIVILLRDPVERAYSNYLLHVRDGMETLSFQDALDFEDSRIRDRWWWGYYYKHVGLYSRQVEAYLSVFGDHVCILFYDQFKQFPLEFFEHVERHLRVGKRCLHVKSEYVNSSGLPRNRLISRLLNIRDPLRPWLMAMVPRQLRAVAWTCLAPIALRKPPPMPEECRELLQRYFEPDLVRLRTLLNACPMTTNIPAWLIGTPKYVSTQENHG